MRLDRRRRRRLRKLLDTLDSEAYRCGFGRASVSTDARYDYNAQIQRTKDAIIRLVGAEEPQIHTTRSKCSKCRHAGHNARTCKTTTTSSAPPRLPGAP